MAVEVDAQTLMETQDCPVPGCSEALPCKWHPENEPRYAGTLVVEPQLCRRCEDRPVKKPSTPRGPYANLCTVCIKLVGEEIAAKKKDMTVEEYRESKRPKPKETVADLVPLADALAAAAPEPVQAGPLLEKLVATQEREALALRVGLLVLDLIDYARVERPAP